MSSRPSSFPEWATAPTAGDVVEPSEAKKESGWRKVNSVAEKPPYEHFNWWQNLVGQWCAFANEAMPSGVVSSFAGSTVPDGWLLCCTNCRSLAAADFARQVLGASRKLLHTRPSPMPGDFTGDPYLKSIWVSA
jgi:hypothetical protein